MNKKYIFFSTLLLIIFLCIHLTVTAQTRRALLVGINNYKHEEPVGKPLCRKVEKVKNLSGCLNDVEAMKGILTSRFYFEPGNIHVLTNEQATKVNILSSIDTCLIREAAPGDMCVFYFAGHGSRIKNSKSNEPDKKDETLVPVDWYRNGDIRDKELKRLFNAILDKRANLTVIIDACHSGSISRGIRVPLVIRSLPESNCDAADPPDNEKEPAERGGVILSAARYFQAAMEKKVENGDYYGLFTWALLKVLRSVPVDEPIGNILLRANALMHSEGLKQDVPMNTLNMEALPELRNKPLFGSYTGRDIGIAASVVEVRGNTLKLLAGYAAGIRKNCVLQQIAESHCNSIVRVQVTKVYGLNLCLAKVMRGDAVNIKVGDFFEVYRWVAPPGERMRVWIPVSSLSYKDLLAFSRQGARLKNCIYPLVTEIELYHDSIEIVSSICDAHYILKGRLGKNSLAYAWVLPNMAGETDPLPVEPITMPISTRWITAGKTSQENRKAAIELRNILLKLVKIRAWLRLSSPPDKGDFPYRLALKHAKTGEVKTIGPLLQGEKYKLVLRAYKEKPGIEIHGRYVYVFSINSSGKGTLLFPPRHRMNSEYYFPAVEEFQRGIQLGDKALFNIGEPFGVDIYFLLTSEEAIANPEVLDFEGVRGPPSPGKNYTFLEKLLYGLGSSYRGNPPETYTNWSIQRLPILSVPRED